MDFSHRNKKVALARWQKIHTEERQNVPKRPESLRLKALLCGFLAGDGSVHIRKEKKSYHYEAGFYPDDILMLESYCNAVRYLYGKSPSVKKCDSHFEVRISSKTILKDLLSVASFSTEHWTLPHALFSVPGAKEAWLKGFFSSEAYVAPNTIKIQTINQSGMKQVSDLLNSLGIQSRYFEYTPKVKRYKPVGIVTIGMKESRQKYLQNIGFCHLKKTKALKEALGL